jgi:hypothetical protein
MGHAVVVFKLGYRWNPEATDWKATALLPVTPSSGRNLNYRKSTQFRFFSLQIMQGGTFKSICGREKYVLILFQPLYIQTLSKRMICKTLDGSTISWMVYINEWNEWLMRGFVVGPRAGLFSSSTLKSFPSIAIRSKKRVEKNTLNWLTEGYWSQVDSIQPWIHTYTDSFMLRHTSLLITCRRQNWEEDRRSRKPTSHYSGSWDPVTGLWSCGPFISTN